MPLSLTDYALWTLATLLEFLLCSLILKHRTYHALPFFSAYMFFFTARTLSLWWIYHDQSLEPGLVFNLYWVTQIVVVLGRGLVAAEVCRLALREHRGVWGLTWRLLAGLGAILVAFAGLAAYQNTRWIDAVTLRGERGLEIVIIGVLVALFSVCRYYGIRIEPVVKYLALGLGLHAAIQTANNSLMFAHFESFFPWWNGIRVLSLDVALLIWCWGLRKAVVLAEAPKLLEAEVYGELAPQVSYRLRELNSRLVEILK